jgi:diguanylate cyclase (GGDEF)-like protein/PAS domain S-box-containing protein
MEYEYEGQKKLAGYSFAPTPGWGLIVQQPLDEALAGVRATRRANLFIALLAGAGAIAFGLILAGKLSRPITQISGAASRLADGDLSVRLHVLRRDELGRLADSFNDMALQLQKRDEALRESEQRYRSLVDNLKIGVYRSQAGPPGRFIQANPAMASIFGYDSVEEFLQQDVETLFQKTGDRAAFLAKVALQGTLTDEELALRKQDGTPIWCTYNVVAHFDAQGRIEWIDGVMENVTERKMRQRWQSALYQISAEISRADSLSVLFKALHKVVSEFMPANRFFIALRDDLGGKLKIVYAASLEGEFTIFEVIPAGLMEEVFRSGEPLLGGAAGLRGQGAQHLAVPLKSGDGQILGVMGVADGGVGSGFTEHHLGMLDFWSGQIAAAIERKTAEDNLRFVSLHDALTKLYNRNYFEEEMKRLDKRRVGSVAVVVFDLDGLKMVNDTLGHEQGDRMLAVAAQILSAAFRAGDVVARIGGDEFAALLEEASEELLGQIRERIRLSTEQSNRQQPDEVALPISLSMGYALSVGSGTPMRELFRQADNAMYREKLNRGQSTRNSIVQTVMKMLKARDFMTEKHSDRLQYLVSQLAQRRGLSPERIADICLLAQFHDIGKVGIPDRILMKPGPLTADEMAEMQKHCEIGHRISLALPELEAISEWVLKHQEWWNGEGYPLGIAGGKIPLECRILAIADAYDAMTNDRPYRPAMSHQTAIAELVRCAGTQFDPELVRVFTSLDLAEIGLDRG